MRPPHQVERPAGGHRSVPLLTEPALGHYPEFRDFFLHRFGLADDPFAPPPVLAFDGRLYELVFVGYSGCAFPAEVRVNALVPGLEPLDEAADADLWSLLEWIVTEVGGEWTADGLDLTGRIYKLASPGGPEGG
jgi:hypothetical protein